MKPTSAMHGDVSQSTKVESGGRVTNATLRVVVILAISMGGESAVYADEARCGSLENAFGPYDYTNPEHRKEPLQLVEKAHFTWEVETLKRGNTSHVWDDLDYTLRAFPNHYRALRAMANYQLRNSRPPTARYRTIDCYFDRAIRFKPNDAEIYSLYGEYLHQKGELRRALESYRKAEEIRPNGTADRDYRIGMLLFDLKDYKQAREYAKRAYERSSTRNDLRDRLRGVGEWEDS